MKKLVSLLTTLLLAAGAHAQSSKAPTSSPTAAPAPSWDRAGHIRLCEHRGDKHCAVLTIPPGVRKGMTGVVSTKMVPGVTRGFIIAGQKNVYLCASGVSGDAKLRCQRLPPALQTLGAPPATDVVAANLQNTITLLLAPRPKLPPSNDRTLGGCDNGSVDEETGEPAGGGCDDGGAGASGSGGNAGGSWSDVPDPETAPNGATAEDLAAPWILEMVDENEIAFEHSGRNFVIDQGQCNVLVARCREDCSDRTAERSATCASVVGLIALGPNWAKVVALLVGVACVRSIYDSNAQCKSDCTFFACIPQ